MSHEWITEGSVRSCRNCDTTQERLPIHEWMRVVGYRWVPDVEKCKPKPSVEILHVLKDRRDPNYKDCWNVVRPTGKESLINRLSELRQDGIKLHRGVVDYALPPQYKFLANDLGDWSCYWFARPK